ncbi:MAG: hypothetical protein SF123_10900 [Chloroflexota bacterium]|nr:hypothetical protein [Chloroflexota bacterium]
MDTLMRAPFLGAQQRIQIRPSTRITPAAVAALESASADYSDCLENAWETYQQSVRNLELASLATPIHITLRIVDASGVVLALAARFDPFGEHTMVIDVDEDGGAQ